MNDSHLANPKSEDGRVWTIMIAFTIWMKANLLAWMIVGIAVLEWQGFFAVRALSVWISVAWTIGIIAPIAARSWKAWFVWTILGAAVYWITIVVAK